MDSDDLEPPARKARTLAQTLEALSVDDLNNFIADRKADIAAAEAEIKRRGGAKSAAEALFGKKK